MASDQTSAIQTSSIQTHHLQTPPLQTPPLQTPPLQTPWRIGVDVGGTFTDLVLVDVAGTTHVAKVPS
ncbi:hypothetical protein K0U73_11945, partial [bacterium]|nr:hypothetical protein [bacterium]